MTRRIMMALAFAALAGFSGLAEAAEFTVGEIRVEQPWARASATKAAKAGAAYFTLVNLGDEADRLTGVATPRARMASLHHSVMDQGVMKMLPVAAIEVSPGEPAVLRPGGLHVMLMGLKAPLVEGETFTLTLTFEKAGSVEIEVTIQGPAAMRPGMMHKHGES